MTNTKMILPLDSIDADLQSAGGKGANLSRLVRFRHPVPDGFIIPILVYQKYIQENQLSQLIAAKMALVDPLDLNTVEPVSEIIRNAFRNGVISAEMQQEILASYHHLAPKPVAVRSSASAEDLPELSFAGQQDTYLNITDETQLLDAVKRCWGSLWTSRAIQYRIRNKVDQTSIGLAVIVQCMVASQVSGVMFTANPLTGCRSEIVIDGTYGLGEALVSGKVEPDQYIVDSFTWKIASVTLGKKALQIVSDINGGTKQIDQQAALEQALPDEVILSLARMGKQIEKDFSVPQDIEWAWADDQLYILQSRPITSLFPMPTELPERPLSVMFSFGSVQGMLDPITPLGQDALKLILMGGRSLFHMEANYKTQKIAIMAAERMWVNITTPIRNTVGRKFIANIFTLVEPAGVSIIQRIWDHPDLLPNSKGMRLRTVLNVIGAVSPIFMVMVLNFLDPVNRQKKMNQIIEVELERMNSHSCTLTNLQDRLSFAIEQIQNLKTVFPRYARYLIGCIASGMSMLYRITDFSETLIEDGRSLGPVAMELTRGMPNNVTTEMDLLLWEISQKIANDPESRSLFITQEAGRISQLYQASSLPTPAQTAVNDFLAKYGSRGLAEIDLGRFRWSENPEAIIRSLQSYIKIKDPELAPDQVFARGKVQAEEAADHLISFVKKTNLGWLKARVLRWAIFRMRTFAGMRESPKFFIIRWLDNIRQVLLKAGSELVEQGFIERKDDLFFLSLAELESYRDNPTSEWKEKISLRRSIYDREKFRKQVPRILCSDGRAFYEGMGAIHTDDTSVIVGSPVSAGVFEGIVHVVLDPFTTHLEPGEILVCPGTDPAWTPLFLAAGALVMEVGGLMTHGAVVAREYGIPAVVGIDQATTRFRNGDRIRVNGSTGEIQRIVE